MHTMHFYKHTNLFNLIWTSDNQQSDFQEQVIKSKILNGRQMAIDCPIDSSNLLKQMFIKHPPLKNPKKGGKY